MRERRWYQIECAKYTAEHECAGIFMDKRLGKIIAAFDWAITHQLKNILVVAPLSATPGWLDDAEADGLKAVLLHGTQNDRSGLFLRALDERVGDEPIFFIINPQGLYHVGARTGTGKPQPTELALMPWDGIIWDETVALKNPKAQITKVAHALAAKVSYRCGLSGEYAPEGIEDSFEQMRWIFGTFMGFRNYYKWRHQHFDNFGYDWVLKSGSRAMLKQAIHDRCYVLSRSDAGMREVKTFERRWCDLPQKVRKAYDQVERFMEMPYGDEGETIETKYGLVSHTWLSQVAGGFPPIADLHSPHKVNLLLELLELYKHEPVVVIFRFNAEIEGVAQALKRKGIVFSTITGATAPADRRERQHLFQAGKLRAFLLQIKVAKYGLTLSRSSTMIRYSLSDPWDDISQSMDRIVDPMKKDPLAYIDLCTRNTTDEDRLDALGEKGIDARYYMNRFRDLFLERKMLKEQLANSA